MRKSVKLTAIAFVVVFALALGIVANTNSARKIDPPFIAKIDPPFAW